MTTETTEQETPAIGGPTTSTWLKGCGIGCLVIIIILIAVSFFSYRWVMGMINKMSAEFVDRGFVKVQASAQTINDKITKPTVFVGQLVKIMDGASSEVAIVAQMAEIHGTFEQKVYFRGQVLDVSKDAVLAKGLDAKVSEKMIPVVQVYGKIEGPITGKYQMMDYRKKPASPATASAPATQTAPAGK